MLVTSGISARMEVERVLAGAVPAPSDTDVAAAVDAARVADAAGLPPSDPAWSPTFDTDLAVAGVADVLAVRAQIGGGTVAQWSSEGTTVQMTPTDWEGIAARFRARSVTLASAATGWSWITLERGDVNDLDPRSAEFER